MTNHNTNIFINQINIYFLENIYEFLPGLETVSNVREQQFSCSWNCSPNRLAATDFTFAVLNLNPSDFKPVPVLNCFKSSSAGSVEQVAGITLK